MAFSNSIVNPIRSCVRRRAHLLLFLPLAAPLAGCGSESTAPRSDLDPVPGITFIAGENVTDTIDAPLSQPLHIVVRDTAGRAMPGVAVRFSSVRIARPDGTTAPSVLVGDVGAAGVSSFVSVMTSADGEALARIVMGRVAGAGAVAIEVPQIGIRDTACYTVEPGAATQVVLPVADTTIEVGHTLALTGRIEDRYGNTRPDAVTYEVVGTGLTLTADQVSASEPARAAVIGRLDGSSLESDTMWVSVVPVATIAARRGNKLVTAGLDGTRLMELPHDLEAGDYGPEWHPNGQSLLAVLGTFVGPSSLHRVELDGATEHVIGPNASGDGYLNVPGKIMGFSYSPDGQWVYLSGGNCNFNAILYRLPVADPQALERLSPTGMDECFQLVNHWPSLSPDGARLAFENQTGNKHGYSVRIMTIATREVTEVIAGGQRPRWSPAGDLIAYWADDQIWVVRPDGTGARAISPPGRNYIPGVQWSPDGEWILARFEPRQGWAGTTVALLRVSAPLEIPLAWTTGYNGIALPAWMPEP